ncbi:MAG TPA: hypothetical protein VF195_12695 [Actinomycetota bacterium]
MADLRERLRGIEAAEPPDLWAGIESQAEEKGPAMDTNVTSIDAFRTPGWQQRRRISAGLVAAAVVTLTVVVAWGALRVPTTVITPPQTLPTGWERCTNAALGFSIGYPGDWHTTNVFDGTPDPANACQWFSPQPFGPQGNLVSEGWGYPLEVATRGPFEQVLAREIDPQLVDVLVNEEVLVDGRRAVRLEYETVSDEVGDNGLHYEYLIEVDPETTLIVHTTTTRGIVGVYAENKVVVDRAIETIRFLPAA